MSISKVIATFTDEKDEVIKRKLKVVCPNASQGASNDMYNDIRAVFPEYLYDENFFIEIDGKVILPADSQKFGDCVQGLKSLDIVIKVECYFVKKNTQKKIKEKKLQIMDGITHATYQDDLMMKDFKLTSEETEVFEFFKSRYEELSSDVNNRNAIMLEELKDFESTPNVVRAVKSILLKVVVDVDSGVVKNQCETLTPKDKLKLAFCEVLGKSDEIKLEDLVMIQKESWGDIQKQITDWNKTPDHISLFKIMLSNIMARLSSSENFSTLCQHDVFTKNEQSPLFEFSEKMILVLLLEKFPICNYKIPGKAQPFLYYSPLDDKYKIALSAYYNLLVPDRPIIVSLGEGKIGKSNLINRLFFTEFEEHS
ncbi:hypothetical protein RFI_35174, partial [Reticulomyxa filosa]